jgi:PKD repeat protein
MAMQVLPAAPAETPPVSGEWRIFGPVVLENGMFHLNGTVYVFSGASLAVRNSTLVFDRSCTIVVEGALEMTGSRVLPAPGAGQGAIEIRGGNVDLSRCSMDNISLSLNDGIGRIAGCNFTGTHAGIYQNTQGHSSYDLEIYNCTFLECYNGCIRSNTGSLAVAGCRFFLDASDRVDFAPKGALPGPLPDDMLVQANLFSGLGMGINIASPYNAWPKAIELNINGYQPRLVCGNVFSGFGTGIDVSGYYGVIEASGNRLAGCDIAIDASSVDTYEIKGLVANNTIEGGGTGIRVYSKSLGFVNNTISNCTGSGFLWSSSGIVGAGPVIRENNITGCVYGAYFLNLAPQFRNNTVSGCAVEGVRYSIASSFSYSPEISNNTFTNCGFREQTSSDRQAAVAVLSDDRTTILLSGNRIRDCPAVGILADGGVRIENNTLEEVATGIACSNTWYARQEMGRNRLNGGNVGLLLAGTASVHENDISNVGTGILFPGGVPGAELRIAGNAIHSVKQGIVVRNPDDWVKSVEITGNVIAASVDGVLADSVAPLIAANDFGGTSGFCVHAIGREPQMGENSFGPDCSGRLLQEWYLTVRAMESPDPYSGTQWSFTDRFWVRARDGTGALAFNAGAGDSTAVKANLAGQVIGRDGERTVLSGYSVTASKPRVGVGWTLAALTENALATLQLKPRYDLAVQDLALPGGRPAPGQIAMVEATVVQDNTYDIFDQNISAVTVSLRDNGVPIGEKQIPYMEPNSTATILFPWNADGGVHNLTAMVDPGMMKAEAFEDNNELSREISVNEVPVPVLSVSDRYPAAGRTVAFMSSGSTDDRGVARSLFEFGDGTDSGWTEEPTVLHVYGRPGVYEARLRVADAENLASNWSPPELITVTEGRLEAALAANSTSFDTLVPVLLAATPGGTPGAPMSYAWSFGDGSSEMGTASRQAHAYARAGNYTASVTVTDWLGRRGSAAVLLSVRNRPPEAALSFSPSAPTVLAPVQFSSLSSDRDGWVALWRWDLGDGNRSSDPAPRHLYTAKGEYTVTLEVRDDTGDWSAAAAARLSVRNTPPSARAAVSAWTVQAGETVRLDAGLTSDPDDSLPSLTFLWSSPDGWSSAGPDASRRFDAPGRHRITLTVTDGWGDSSQDVVTVQVLPAGEAGGAGYRPAATALSASAVAVFLLALFIFGRDRTGPRRTTTHPGRGVKRGGGKNI